jgi:CDP-glucose 4,6-dehydratase
MGTANVLEALKNIDNECVTIVVTSDKCYDNVEWQWGYRETDAIGGKDIYSGSKGAAEIVFKSFYNSFFLKTHTNIKLASARAGNVIGGGDWAKERIVPDCFRAWNLKQPVSLRQPMATRPWQFVLEPLSGYLLLAIKLQKDQKLNGESYNFGPFSHNNQSVLDLLKDLSKYWDFNDFEPFNINKKTLYNEAGLLKLNCDKALLDLKWTPTLNYDELIEFTGTWYRDFYGESNKIDAKTIEQIIKYQSLANQRSI